LRACRHALSEAGGRVLFPTSPAAARLSPSLEACCVAAKEFPMIEFCNWLCNSSQTIRSRSRSAPRPKRAQPSIEHLEDRTVPTILFQPQFDVEGFNHHSGVLNDVPVYLIFWGTHWQTPAAGNPNADAVRSALAGLLDSPYFQGLTQYGVDGRAHL